MSVALQRAQTQTLFAAVSGVSQVHDYERYSNDPKVAADWFTRQGKLNVFFLQADVLDPTPLTTSEQEQRTEWTLVGYLQVDDSLASKKTAEDLVQTLVDVKLAARTLSGTATNSTPPKPERITNVLVAIGEKSVLAHRIVIRWITEQRVDVTYA